MRVVLAFLPAAAVTLALFCLMQYLVTGSRMPPALPDYPGFVDLVHLDEDPETQDSSPARRALPEQARLPEEMPALPEPVTTASQKPDFSELALAMPGLSTLDLDQGPYLAPPGKPVVAKLPERLPERLPDTPTSQPAADAPAPQTLASVPATPGIGAPGSGMTGDGSTGDEVIPLLMIEPDYPRKAARSGKEGWVKVEFTITEHGTVVDPVVVEARPRRLFNRSALSAIRKWQFKPKFDDGVPVSRRASQVIEFNLATR